MRAGTVCLFLMIAQSLCSVQPVSAADHGWLHVLSRSADLALADLEFDTTAKAPESDGATLDKTGGNVPEKKKRLWKRPLNSPLEFDKPAKAREPDKTDTTISKKKKKKKKKRKKNKGKKISKTKEESWKWRLKPALEFNNAARALEFNKTAPGKTDTTRSKKKKKRKKKKRRWRWRIKPSVAFSYDSNPFNLSGGQRGRLEEDRLSDQTSGRFDDMREKDDFIFSPRTEIAINGPGLNGRRLKIQPGIRFDYYTQNPRKSHPGLSLRLKQDLPSRSSLALDVEYEIDDFPKNHLKDATDLTGNVSSSDRVYRPGDFNNLITELTYRHRLLRRSKKKAGILGLRRVFGNISAGYENRKYENFGNRDRDVARAGLGLDFGFNRSLDVSLDYLLRYVHTPNDAEVLIRDEPDFAFDFNGDLDALDQNRRTVQKVDRSHFYHLAELTLRYRLLKRWHTWAGYKAVFQNYESQEPFDSSHRRRKDFQHRVRIGVSWRFTKRMGLLRNPVLAVQGEYIHDNVDRRGQPADENDQRTYDRFIAWVALSASI